MDSNSFSPIASFDEIAIGIVKKPTLKWFIEDVLVDENTSYDLTRLYWYPEWKSIFGMNRQPKTLGTRLVLMGQFRFPAKHVLDRYEKQRFQLDFYPLQPKVIGVGHKLFAQKIVVDFPAYNQYHCKACKEQSQLSNLLEEHVGCVADAFYFDGDSIHRGLKITSTFDKDNLNTYAVLRANVYDSGNKRIAEPEKMVLFTQSSLNEKFKVKNCTENN